LKEHRKDLLSKRLAKNLHLKLKNKEEGDLNSEKKNKIKVTMGT